MRVIRSHFAVTRSAAQVPVQLAANLLRRGRPADPVTRTDRSYLGNLIVCRDGATASVHCHAPFTSRVRRCDIGCFFSHEPTAADHSGCHD